MIPALVLGLVAVPSADAGAWTRDAGSYYAKAGADGYWALRWDQVGTKSRKTDRYLGQQYGAYGEAGLSKGHPFQLAAGLPMTVGTLWFRRANQAEVADGRATVYRLGDLRLTPQVALHPDKPIALAMEVKIPLYSVDSICDDNVQFRDLCPRPGDGQVDLTGWLLGGAGFDWGFLEGGVGWTHRTEWYLGWDTRLMWSDSVSFAGGGGVWLGPALAMMRVDGNVAPMDDQLTPQAVRAGPAALIDLSEGVALEARAQLDLWALNTARGLGFGLGLSTRR